MAANQKKSPVAPPVYRPQAASNAAQSKMAKRGDLLRRQVIVPPTYQPVYTAVQSKLNNPPRLPKPPVVVPISRQSPHSKILQPAVAAKPKILPGQIRKPMTVQLTPGSNSLPKQLLPKVVTTREPIFRNSVALSRTQLPMPIPKVASAHTRPAPTGPRAIPIVPPVHRRNVVMAYAANPGSVTSGASRFSSRYQLLGQELAANGLRLKVGKPATNGRIFQKRTAAIQAKMGMELELPIVITKANYEIVPSKETIMEGIYYKIEGDRSKNIGKVSVPHNVKVVDDHLENPTIVEVVTHPIDEHLYGAETLLQEQIAAIDKLIAVIKEQTKTGPTTAKQVAQALGLAVTPGYEDALIGVPTTGGKLNQFEDSANMHFTIGVGYSQIGEAFNWMTLYHGGNATTSSNSELAAAELLEVINDVFTAGKVFDGVDQMTQQALLGYLRLAVSNIMAIEAYELNKKSESKIQGGVAKNYTLALARTPFTSIWAKLPKSAKDILQPPGKPGLSLLPNILEAVLRTLKTKEAKEYAQGIFKIEAGAQSAYFGGMRELKVEDVGPATGRFLGVPLELRHLGDKSRLNTKEWHKTAFDLLNKSRQWHGTKDPSAKHLHPSMALPSGWELKLTERGKPYYFNEDTGSLEAQFARLQQPHQSQLPQGWKAVATSAAEFEGVKVYFYRQKDNKTQWERPVEEKLPVARSLPVAPVSSAVSKGGVSEKKLAPGLLPVPTSSKPSVAVPHVTSKPASSPVVPAPAPKASVKQVVAPPVARSLPVPPVSSAVGKVAVPEQPIPRQIPVPVSSKPSVAVSHVASKPANSSPVPAPAPKAPVKQVVAPSRSQQAPKPQPGPNAFSYGVSQKDLAGTLKKKKENE